MTAPSHGTVHINNNNMPTDPADDTIYYAPAAGFIGTDTFGYTITDPAGVEASATVHDTAAADANTVVASGNALNAITDVDGGTTLSVTAVNGIAAGVGHDVAGSYGTLGPLGFPRRSVFVVDGDGVIRYAHRAIAGLTYRPVSELIEAVKHASA